MSVYQLRGPLHPKKEHPRLRCGHVRGKRESTKLKASRRVLTLYWPLTCDCQKWSLLSQVSRSCISAICRPEIPGQELVCRLIYEEKRLYIHEVGGERMTMTVRNHHSVDILRAHCSIAALLIDFTKILSIITKIILFHGN